MRNQKYKCEKCGFVGSVPYEEHADVMTVFYLIGEHHRKNFPECGQPATMLRAIVPEYDQLITMRMRSMVKVWDRKDYPELITGVRACYQTKIEGLCKNCNKPTYRVIDYLGKLSFDCGQNCLYTENKIKKEETSELSKNKR